VLRHLGGPEAAGAAAAAVILLAVTVAILTSLLLGFVNGFLIAVVGVSPILATLGTMTLYDGLAIAITKGYVISDFPRGFLVIENGTMLGIPFSLIIFILCAYLMVVALNRKPFGVGVYMMGSNAVATEYSGINVRSVLINVYLISGLLSGIASVIMTSRFNSANAGYGASYLLITVLIAVLGGVNPFGGFGKISGLVMALIILQFISSGLNLLGVTAFVTLSLWGTILILVMRVGDRPAKAEGRVFLRHLQRASAEGRKSCGDQKVRMARPRGPCAHKRAAGEDGKNEEEHRQGAHPLQPGGRGPRAPGSFSRGPCT
jgi:simple sugar transport system permease protein